MNRFSTTSGYKKISIVLSLLIVLMSLNPVALAQEGDIANESLEVNSEVLSSGLQAKITETLNYINEVDDLPIDFDQYISESQMERKRLTQIQTYLVHVLEQKFRFEDISDDQVQSNTADSVDVNKAKISDLVHQIEKELAYNELFISQRQMMARLLYFLQANDLSTRYEALQSKADLELELMNELVNLSSDRSEQLLADLQLESSITQYWLTYFERAQALRDQLDAYLKKDFSLGEIKALAEGDSLVWLGRLYPNPEDYNQLLDERSRNLFSIYEARDVDLKIKKIDQLLPEADEFLSLIESPLFEKTLDIIDAEIILQAAFDEVKAGQWSSASDELSQWLKDKNNFDAEEGFFVNQYKVLDFFRSVFEISGELVYEANQEFLNQLIIPLQNFKESTESQAKASDNPVETSSPVESLDEAQNQESENEEGVVDEAPSDDEGVEVIEDISNNAEVAEEVEATDEVQAEESNDVTVEVTEPVVDKDVSNEPAEPAIDPLPKDESESAEVVDVDENLPINADSNQEVDESENPIIEPSDEPSIDPKEVKSKPLPNNKNSNPSAQDLESVDAKQTSPKNKDIESLKPKKDDLLPEAVELAEAPVELVDDNDGSDPVETSSPVESLDEAQNQESENEEGVVDEAPSDDEGVEVIEDISNNAEVAEEVEATDEVQAEESNDVTVEVTEPVVDKDVSNEPAEPAIDPLPKDESESAEVVDVDEEGGEDEVVAEEVDIDPLNEEVDLELVDEEVVEVEQIIDQGISLSESEADDVIDFFEGNEDALDNAAFIRQLIEGNESVILIADLIESALMRERLALLTNKFLQESNRTIESFNTFYEVNELTDDDWDAWVNFMNQLIIQYSQNSDNGIISQEVALRYDKESCDYSEFSYDFTSINQFSYSHLNQFLSTNNIAVSDDLFCLVSSDDITTKNVAGYPNFTKQIIDDYQITQESLQLGFVNNATRDINAKVNLVRNGPAYDFSIHYDEKEADSDSVNIVAEKVDDEAVDDLPEAIDSMADAVDKAHSTYAMSSLASETELFSGLTEEDSEQVVVYEAGDKNETIVHRFVTQANGVQPYILSTYHLIKNPSEAERRTVDFEGLLLKDSNGVLSGHLPSNDLSQLFVMDEIYAVDRNNEEVESFNYQVSDNDPSQLIISTSVSADRYPIAIYSRLKFILPGQSPYDLAIPSNQSIGHIDQAMSDINGDGQIDFIRSIHEADGSNAKIEFYYAPISSSPQFFLSSDEPFFGHNLYLSDINNDSVPDLVAANPFYDQKRGRILIYYGTGNGYLGSPDLTLIGAGVGHEFGTSVLANDFNQSEGLDLIVGAPGQSASQGVVYFFWNETLLSGDELRATDANMEFKNDTLGATRFGERLYASDLNQDEKIDLMITNLIEIDQLRGQVNLIYQKEDAWQDRPVVDQLFEGPGLFGSQLMVHDVDHDGKNDLLISTQDPSLRVQESHAELFLFLQNENPWTNQEMACEFNCAAENADFMIEFPSSDWIQDIKSITHNEGLGIIASTYSFVDSRANIYSIKSNLDAPYFESLVQVPQFRHQSFNRLGADLLMGDLNQDQKVDLVIGSYGRQNFDNYSYVYYGQKSASGQLEEPVLDDLNNDEEDEEDPLEDLEEEVVVDDEVQEEVLDEVVNEQEAPSSVDKEVPSSTSENDQVIVVDSTVPVAPEIECHGAQSGVYTSQNSFVCQWNDTTDSAPSQFYYCIDSDDSCEPIIESADRSVTIIGLTDHRQYLRVMNQDEGGKSEVTSFEFAIDSLPELVSGPSDGSSSLIVPTDEEGIVLFSATANDADSDPYQLLVCRTSGQPTYNSNGEPVCLGGDLNQYCVSSKTSSGEKAVCDYSVANEEGVSAIWYAFVCSGYDAHPACSTAYQGDGVEGSPLYIKRTPRFESVFITDVDNDSIEPGDRLKFVVPATSIKNMVDDRQLDMYVCSDSTTEFDPIAGDCEGGNLICATSSVYSSDIDYVCEESENNLVPQASVSGENVVKFYLFVDNEKVEGDDEWSYEVVDVPTELIGYDGEGEIDLAAGGSDEVLFAATLKDMNGWDDLIRVEGILYDESSVEPNCIESQKNCYIHDQCAIELITETELAAYCSVNIFYNANASDSWRAYVRPIFNKGRFDKISSSKFTYSVPEITAINQKEISVPYSLTLPGETSDSVEVILSNLGNQPVDLLVDGTPLQGKLYKIEASAQHWSYDEDFDYEKGYPLVTEAILSGSADGCMNIDLPVHQTVDSPNSRSIYWRIAIPKQQKSDLYQGTVQFKPVSVDSCK